MRLIVLVMIFLMLTSTLAGCLESDNDGDGINDDVDNCPDVDNPLQEDHDIAEGLDGGNECDEDDDNDGWSDEDEFSCETDSLNSSSIPTDTDSDTICDFIDEDDDNDGWTDVDENDCGSDKNQFLNIPNDRDSDGICDTLDGSHAPIISFNPMSDWYRADSSISFSSMGFDYDNDILEFTWFFGDGSIGYGDSVNHLYEEVGDYLVTLSVSDGTYIENISNNIKVVSSDARGPHAHIQEIKYLDCDGEEPPNGEFILIWLCEEKEINDRNIEILTSIYLNGSNSWAGCDPNDSNCYAEEYIVSYEWDLDIYSDSDGDGIPDNDLDYNGSVANLQDISPGARTVQLKVTDNNGLTHYDEIRIYVNYRGTWTDFDIVGQSGDEPTFMSWEFPLSYDQEKNNKIRYLRLKLTYNKYYDEQNILDIYVYNSTDEEVFDSSGIGEDNRNAGECDSENHCVWLVAGGSALRGFLPGTWTVDLQNEKTHNTEVESLVIELQYR